MRFFSVPVHGAGPAEEELNRFLASVRVVDIDRHFVAQSSGSFWAVAVTFVESQSEEPKGRRPSIDYKEVLPAPEFTVYAKLRELRKKLAHEEGLPVYAVFTNEQLAAMVQRRVRSKSALEEISGVGRARVEKYGTAFLQLLASLIPQLESPGEERVATDAAPD